MIIFWNNTQNFWNPVFSDMGQTTYDQKNMKKWFMKVIIFLLRSSNHEYLIRINFEAVTNKLEEGDSKSILREKYFFVCRIIRVIWTMLTIFVSSSHSVPQYHNWFRSTMTLYWINSEAFFKKLGKVNASRQAIEMVVCIYVEIWRSKPICHLDEAHWPMSTILAF